MCITCGCGMLNTRHQSTDIILDDLKRAASGQKQSVDEVVDNIKKSLDM